MFWIPCFLVAASYIGNAGVVHWATVSIATHTPFKRHRDPSAGPYRKLLRTSRQPSMTVHSTPLHAGAIAGMIIALAYIPHIRTALMIFQ